MLIMPIKKIETYKINILVKHIMSMRVANRLIKYANLKARMSAILHF